MAFGGLDQNLLDGAEVASITADAVHIEFMVMGLVTTGDHDWCVSGPKAFNQASPDSATAANQDGTTFIHHLGSFPMLNGTEMHSSCTMSKPPMHE